VGKGSFEVSVNFEENGENSLGDDCPFGPVCFARGGLAGYRL
jgi:hypothetical protein